MKRHTRIVIAALIALAGLLATVVPADALGFLLPTRFSMKRIESLAAYVPQRTCQPAAKVGTRSLLAFLERKYPGTGSLGISRACNIGGRSEHKEGRALDWDVNYYSKRQRAQAEDMINWLLKRDKMGRPFANARRLGVMYVIWDNRIWSSDSRSWRAYHGASAHRDHMHISLSWAGARARTSFWSGNVVRTIEPFVPGASPTGSPAPTPSPSSSASPTSAPSPSATASAASTLTSSYDAKVLSQQEDALVWPSGK